MTLAARPRGSQRALPPRAMMVRTSPLLTSTTETSVPLNSVASVERLGDQATQSGT
jgi:hypothetical protein